MLLNLSSKSKGADASLEDLENIENSKNLAKKLAKKYKTIVAITGKVDVISDGTNAVSIENESDALQKITGTGCMCTSLVASFCGANKEMIFEATVLGEISPKIKTNNVNVPVAIPIEFFSHKSIAKAVTRAEAEMFTILLPTRMALSILDISEVIFNTLSARLLPSSAFD